MKQRFMRRTLFVLTLFAATLTQASTRSETAMRAAAYQQLAGKLMTASSAGTFSPAADLRELGSTSSYRIYGADGLGFAVVSSDDRFPAVLGYSRSTFDPDNLPCGLRWWLQSVDQSMRCPAAARREASTTYPIIDNFVPTQWGQGDPYNSLCPKINGKSVLSGCVATATSQIMYYYRYPAQGHGNGGYYLNGSSTRTPAVISGTYEWDKMLERYRSTSITDEQREAIGTLLRDVGYGVFMSYESSGSGAYSSSVASSLVDNFDYDPLSMRHYYRDYFSLEEWLQLIATELKAGRPVYYGASDVKNGGHAFFFSGMDADGKVYVNWGWDGTGDGFYDISLLTPTGILGRPGTNNFSEYQSMIIGIKAQPTADEGEYYESNIAMPDSFVVKKFGKRLQCSIPLFYNHGYRTFNGVIGYYFVPVSGEATEPLFVDAYDTSARGAVSSGYGGQVSARFVDVSTLPAGDYRVYVAANDVLQGDYQLVRSIGGLLYYTLNIAEDGTLTVGEITLYDGIHSVASSSTPAAADALTRVYDTAGRLVYSAPSARFNLWDVPARGILLVKQGKQTRKVIR